MGEIKEEGEVVEEERKKRGKKVGGAIYRGTGSGGCPGSEGTCDSIEQIEQWSNGITSLFTPGPIRRSFSHLCLVVCTCG
jgi:hypothetical protein